MKALIQIAILALALTSFGAQAKGGGCKKRLEKACKAAGHKKHKDCYSKLLAGEPVDGVNAQQSDIDACKKHGK